jgi:diguanylate cyclase (GGDEF)-like protein
MAGELQPDLILLDVTMPEISGIEVCRALKSDPRTASLQVIFLSGANDVAVKVLGFELGAIDFVTKPFDAAELRARIRAALRTKRYQDLLATQAQLDALTGLRNRGYFDQKLDEEIRAAQRYERPVSLVLVDIDHFKRINDTYGHPFGDKVLQAVGECLSASVRATDAACRYGGEEFAVILTETTAEEAMLFARRLQARLRGLSFSAGGEFIRITASFGICGTDQGDALLHRVALVSSADDALYDAKHSGRDRICTFVTEQAKDDHARGDLAKTPPANQIAA